MFRRPCARLVHRFVQISPLSKHCVPMVAYSTSQKKQPKPHEFSIEALIGANAIGFTTVQLLSMYCGGPAVYMTTPIEMALFWVMAARLTRESHEGYLAHFSIFMTLVVITTLWRTMQYAQLKREIKESEQL
jgi:hypothetical protein